MPEVQSHAGQPLEDSSEMEHLVAITDDETRRSLASQAGLLIWAPPSLPFSSEALFIGVTVDVLF